MSGRPIIMYTPHQDDLTLFGGRIAAHHVEVGRRLIVVCATDGSTTSVGRKLRGELSSAFWQGTHNPAAEGYAPPTDAQVGQARDREEVNANLTLGAAAGDIHIDWTIGSLSRGANISVAQAEILISHFNGLYPDAGHYTMWAGDQDPNHSALGQALENLHNGQPLVYGDVRWLVRPSEKAAAGALTYDVPEAYDAAANARVRRACRAYDAWAPNQGMFAVGYHSVQDLFLAVEAGEPNYYLRP